MIASILISLAVDLIYISAAGLALLRLFSGVTIEDLQAWYSAREKRNQEDASFSVGLVSKFMYPLLLRGNVQVKSEPYRTASNVLVKDDNKWLEDHNAARRRWLSEQKQCRDRVMEQFLGKSSKAYDTFLDRVKACNNIATIDVIYERGSKVFFYKRIASAGNSPQLYVSEKISVDTLGKAAGHQVPTGARARPQSDEGLRELLTVDGINTPKGSTAFILGTWVCNEGNAVAYAYTTSVAAGQATLRVRDVSSGRDFRDTLNCGLHATHLSVAWWSGKSGFFYTGIINQHSDGSDLNTNSTTNGLQAGSGYHCVFYHTLGTDQADDIQVWCAPKPSSNQRREFYTVHISPDSRYLLISVYDEHAADTVPRLADETYQIARPNRFFYVDVSAAQPAQGRMGEVRKLIDGQLGQYCWDYIGNTKQHFFFRTNYQAPKYRVVCISLPDIADLDLEQTQLLLQKACENLEERIPEGNRILESASIAAKAAIIAKYRTRQYHEIEIYDLSKQHTGSVDAVALPKALCDGVEGPWCDYYSSAFYYKTTNYGDPGSVWRARVARASDTGAITITSLEPLFTPQVPDVNIYDYETVEEVILQRESDRSSLASKDVDGSPLYLQLFRTRNDLNEVLMSKPQGRARRLSGFASTGSTSVGSPDVTSQIPVRSCLLCVYSGFNAEYVPAFSAPTAIFVKHFGATVCVLRVDMSLPLAKAVDCVLEAAVHLVDTGLVSCARHLGLVGGTTGALICSAALNARPDLFGAALLQDGIFDLMNWTNLNPPLPWYTATKEPQPGVWSPTFGNGAQEALPAKCEQLLKLSPLHNVRAYWVRDDELSYPAVLVRTSTDANVNATHSMKYVAELQRVWGSNDKADKPLLLDMELEMQTGVASAEAVDKAAEEGRRMHAISREAEALLFMARYCGAEFRNI